MAYSRPTAKELLAKGKPGTICFMAQKAFSLAKHYRYEGTAMAEVNTPANKLYALTRPDSIIWTMPEDSKEFEELYKAAHAAYYHMWEESYSDEVKDFINLFCSFKNERKANGYNPRQLKHIKWDLPLRS